jgi:nicotinamidase-related amidase
MPKTTGLLFGPIPAGTVHLCVDMQRLFGRDGPWPVPWIEKIQPAVVEIVRHVPAQTIFTRFIPPEDEHTLPGRWQDYYRYWREVTLKHLDERLLGLLPPLQEFVPPAVIVDRHFYSAFSRSALRHHLTDRGTTALVITGGETDVCVLSTVLGAVDRGYRVILVADALCSSSDANHDFMTEFFNTRFSRQIETIDTDSLLTAWSV